ncbi:hypothetical protein BDZ89DRAFT_1063010 [Hymenopellis radicata]|nr:hypothetical protein BDZ89DRAFT_1063010 [Hymenopellis radicata]
MLNTSPTDIGSVFVNGFSSSSYWKENTASDHSPLNALVKFELRHSAYLDLISAH